jgi:hypothetical protein
MMNAASSTRPCAELVLIHIGAWRLALPRSEVRDLLSPQDLDSGALVSHGALGVRIGSQDVPVLLLDDALRPTRLWPAQRRICVVLDADGELFGLICDEFEHQVRSGADTTLHELAPSQRVSGSPLRAVLQIGHAVAAVTDAKALRAAFDAHLAAAVEPA